jgi:hypothetical protein
MDGYWSIELCGWARLTRVADPLVTPWSLPPPAPPLVLHEQHLVPPQRAPEGAPVRA